MSDIIGQLSECRRSVRGGGGGARDSGAAEPSVLLRRAYPAPVEDVWDACTTAERIGRWLAPVSGELRPGGRYQLEGHPGGEIVRCEPPRLLRVTWGPGSQVEVRLAPGDRGAETVFELEHAGVMDLDPALWARFGPGGVGVGWDMALLGLYLYLATGRERPADPAVWAASPEAREFISRSNQAWGTAFREAGASEAEAAAAVAETTAAYAPPLPEGQGDRGRGDSRPR